MTERTILYYRVEPVESRLPTDPPTLMNNAVAICMATGEMLASRGGGGFYLKKEIVDALDMSKNDHRPRVVLDAADYEQLLHTAAMLREHCEATLAGGTTSKQKLTGDRDVAREILTRLRGDQFN